jgi:hypothetical protein
MKVIARVLSLFALALAGCANPIDYASTALVKIGDTLYVDPVVSAYDHAELVRMTENARRRLAAFYGEQRSADPDVVFCRAEACATFYSGTAMRSRALRVGRTGPGGGFRPLRETIVIVQQGRAAENVIVHELSHIEHRVRFGNGRAPTWFHEGVAVYMSGEPDCTGVYGKGVDDLSRLAAPQAWDEYTNDRSRIRQTYCQASAEIGRWVGRHGKAALLKLMDDVRSGKPFAALYGPLPP